MSQVTKVPTGTARGARLAALTWAASIRQGGVNAPARRTAYGDAKAIKAEATQYGKRKAKKQNKRVILRRAARHDGVATPLPAPVE